MKKIFFAFVLLGYQSTFSQDNSYDNAWQALNQNKRADADQFLQKAMKVPATSLDAYITNLYLKTYNGKSKDVKDFITSFYQRAPNPYPYVYALWFNKALLGESGKKNLPNELQLLDELIKDKKAPGELVAAANYQKEFHYLFSADFDKAESYSDQVGNVRNWQFTGPFENLSESGFYKNYGPLDHPEPGAVFKSSSNADVTWFTPAVEIKDGWTPVTYNFRKNTAVIYAQNFVTTAQDQTVYCNVGCEGSIKVWINDELVISESRERVTEMDAYTTKVDLKKGVNRVLIQLGYSNLNLPNFIVRFTDGNGNSIKGITGSSTYTVYPKNSTSNKKLECLTNFAETYFTGKIKEQPDNLLNYLLLADTYQRNSKLIEARDILSKALAKAPDNSLIRMQLIDVLDKQNNKTLYLEELEKIKQADPESLMVLQLNMKEFYDNEKYKDCNAEMEKYKSLYGEDEFSDGYSLMLMAKDNKYNDVVKLAEKIYEKYPTQKEVIGMMYKIKKEVDKNNAAALGIYETYMKDNYNYEVYTDFANILIDQGDIKKGIGIKDKLVNQFPFDPHGYYNLSKYYYSAKNYKEAETYVRKSLALSPYNENYWELLGDIQSEEKNTAAALEDYNKSLKFDPDQYDLIKKIRKLNNQPEISELFPEADISKIIKSDDPDEAKNTDYGYYYILDQINSVLYPDGATEIYSTLIIRITNDKGIDNFKESTINYNNNQTLLIEKAEVIKKNGVKIEGERNDNQIVFTNLEVGDVIVFKYRTQSYTYGRFAKEFWDRYQFGGQIYSAITRYTLLAPATQKVNYKFTNSTIQPTIKTVEDFKEYSWTLAKQEPLKNERLMPLLMDAGTVLHISTIDSWNEISNWYSDITNNKAEEDLEVIALYKKLFPDERKSLSQFEKAKIIYNYIESNIKYSSVSFRQGAFVPQRASKTLTTRLGDCKDLSSLFVTLAHMCGIKAQMVLVDTRDNGQNDIILPSVDFNHCIAKATLDSKDYFIELTDNNLPFTSLPNTLQGANALEVPNREVNEKATLVHLRSDNRIKDAVKRVLEIIPEDGNLKVSVNTVKYGGLSSGVRDQYLNLDSEKQVKEMEKSVASLYQNNVQVEQVKFYNLEKLNDSVAYTYSYKVKNEVSQIGSINTFKIVYPDIVASLDNFSADKRDYPVEYWNYEDADAYETTVHISAPKGQKFIELPKDEILSFKTLKYSIGYHLTAPNKLTVIRKFSDGRPQEISPEDYPAFKSFFEKIVKAEQKYIAYQ